MREETARWSQCALSGRMHLEFVVQVIEIFYMAELGVCDNVIVNCSKGMAPAFDCGL